MYYIFALNVGYLIGSIPVSLILGKLLFNKDIREEGSKNLGSTNANRVFGFKVGVIALLLDGLKPILSILLIYFLVQNEPLAYDIATYIPLAGLGAVLGHCYPLFASFRGGKAVACTFGFLLISNLYLFFIAVALFFSIIFLTKTVSLGSIFSTVITGLLAYLPVFDKMTILPLPMNKFYPLILSLMVIIIIYRHRSNIMRIYEKNERKVTWVDNFLEKILTPKPKVNIEK